MHRLNVVVASTRPGRTGLPVASWFYALAREQGSFAANWVDLADFELPVFDEPNHPRQQKYQHEHTKRWAASVDAADAYVFVVPEYNHGPTPALLNALNYVYLEWNYKPAAFVSYGGLSGGMRSAETSKLILTTLKMVPIFEQVTLPMVSQQVEGGRFTATEQQDNSAAAMLAELRRWSDALATMRRS